MFVRRIPYQSVRRRRIRHWAAAADARGGDRCCIVAAFARPFFQQGAVAAAVGGGAREVVILLDQSASMGYGDHWTARAGRRAQRSCAAWAPTTARRSCCSARTPRRTCARRSDRARLEAAINAAKVGSGATRFGPALKLAESILSRSPLKRREAVLISDFQRSGWSGSEEVRFPEGMTRQHRVGRVARHVEPRGAVGRLRPRVVLRPGAPHRDRRPQQQGRRSR